VFHSGMREGFELTQIVITLRAENSKCAGNHGCWSLLGKGISRQKSCASFQRVFHSGSDRSDGPVAGNPSESIGVPGHPFGTCATCYRLPVDSTSRVITNRCDSISLAEGQVEVACRLAALNKDRKSRGVPIRVSLRDQRDVHG
jgi:hypothetical protein